MTTDEKINKLALLYSKNIEGIFRDLAKTDFQSQRFFTVLNSKIKRLDSLSKYTKKWASDNLDTYYDSVFISTEKELIREFGESEFKDIKRVNDRAKYFSYARVSYSPAISKTAGMCRSQPKDII